MEEQRVEAKAVVMMVVARVEAMAEEEMERRVQW